MARRRAPVYQQRMTDHSGKPRRKSGRATEARPEPVRFRTAGREELLTVEDAAKRLKLHPRTILRFIHEDRLPATRLGKAFRILRGDLEAFAGLPPEAHAPAPASVTCIVDLPGIGEDLARRWARALPAALNAKPEDRAPIRPEISHDPARSQLRIVLVDAPDAVGRLMRLVELWADGPPD
jgi:excisionase family DNA binding protein